MYKFTGLFLLIAFNFHTVKAQPNLIGYYSFCNCDANDNSGYGNHGTLSGNPTCIPGQRGEGFLFNQNPGANGCGQAGGEYVQLPPLGAVWAQGFTVCAWVRFDAVSYYERIIDFGNGSGDSGGMPIWFGREGSSNNLTLESWISSNSSTNRSLGRLVAPNVITNGSIEYYCATISGDTMRIYVNGVLKAEKKGHPVLNVPRSKNFIGRSNWCFADPDFKGFMDEVRIYNRALTEAEINSLYLETPTFSAFQSPVFSGTPVQLEATGGIAYQWSPAETLDDANIPNPIATPYQTTTYTCQVTLADGCRYTDSLRIEVLHLPTCSSICTGSLGENIFPNGDFGSGVANILPSDPGLAPGYIYSTNPPPSDGYYCISNNTTTWGSFAANAWIDIEDNGPEPNGYMMVVNASYQPGLFYQKTVDVCENTPYEFSIDVISLIFSAFPDKIRPNISFLIDGNSVCETGDIPPDELWHTARFSFLTAPGQTTAILSLRNNAPGGNGNDLAIDNISFRTCGPSVTVPPILSFCKGTTVTIPSLVTNSPYATSVYRWQVFVNGAWEDIPNSNNDSITILNPVDGSLFRLLVANGQATISSPNCRIVSEVVELRQLPDLVVNTMQQDVSCAGGSNATASAESIIGAAPFTYFWSNGQTGAINTNLSAGSYQVTITDSLGCTGVATATVLEPPLLTSGATATNVTCFGGQDAEATVLAAGGISPYSYVWSNGQTGAINTNLSAGSYQVTITDALGCMGAATVVVSEPPLLTPGATATNVSCFGAQDAEATVLAAGGVSPYAFVWSNGQTGAINTNLSVGSFQVTITDALGCTGVATAIVSEPPLLTSVATATNVSCFGGQDAEATVLAAGGVSPYAFVWSNGQTGAINTNLSAGSYQVTITDALGCTGAATVIVSEPPLLTSVATATNVSCFGGQDAEATVLAAGGVPPYAFVWNNGQTGAINTNLSAGSYQVTITDALGCTGAATVIVSEPPLLTSVATATNVSCFGAQDAEASVLAAGGVSPYSYAWSNGQTGAINTDLSAGSYQVTITDAPGCTGAATVIVSEPPLLTSVATATNVPCFGGQDAEATVLAAGGVSPYAYVWSNGQTGAINTNLSAGSYQVSITDALGCTGAATVIVSEPPLLTSGATATNVSCFGGQDAEATVLAGGGVSPYSYAWSNGETNSSIFNLMAGGYLVTIVDANACTAVASAAVTEPPVLSSSIATTDVFCFGGAEGSAQVTVAGGVTPYAYIWSSGHTGASVSSLPAGIYTYTATDGEGCTVSGTAMISQPLALSSSLAVEDIGCNGNSTGIISVVASGGTLPYSFLWSNGASSSQITNLASGLYNLSMTDANGCFLTTAAQVNEAPPLILETTKKDITCFGDHDGVLGSFVSGGIGPYAFQWSNGQTSPEISGLAAGSFTVIVTDANGCTVAASKYLEEQTKHAVHLGNDLLVYLGDFIELKAIVNIPQSEVMDYTWSGSEDSLQCADCFHYNFQATGPGCQQVLVLSKRGCVAVDTVCYQIRPHRRVYAPNVFSPNGDGTNDFFTIFSDDGVKQILSLSIFSRWGEQIYQANNILTNDEPMGWDGTFKGKMMNINVFVWVADIEFVDGETLRLSGDVTLVR